MKSNVCINTYMWHILHLKHSMSLVYVSIDDILLITVKYRLELQCETVFAHVKITLWSNILYCDLLSWTQTQQTKENPRVSLQSMYFDMDDTWMTEHASSSQRVSTTAWLVWTEDRKPRYIQAPLQTTITKWSFGMKTEQMPAMHREALIIHRYYLHDIDMIYDIEVDI